MKKYILSTAAIALMVLAGSTFAADLPSQKAPPAPPLPPPPLWTGFYAGLNAGYSWDASPNVFVAGFPVQTGLDNFVTGTYASASALGATGESNAPASGPIGGGQIGYNYQFNTFVLGFEADIQGLGGRGRGSFPTGAKATIVGFTTNDATLAAVENGKSVDWLGTARGRVGYLITPTLLGYATGGLAYGGVTSQTVVSQHWSGPVGQFFQSSGAAGGLSKTLVGWTVGGGVEWAFAPNLSAKAEYLYFDLGDARFVSSPLATSLFGGLSDTVLVASRARFNGHLARVGLNYHFDPFSAPLPSRGEHPPLLWSGFYAGLNAGYAWDGNANFLTSGFPALTGLDASFGGNYAGLSHSQASALGLSRNSIVEADGFIGGGQIGYNYRFDRFVAALETDIQGAGIKGRASFLGVSPVSDLQGRTDFALSSVESEKTVDWLGTMRGRVGYLFSPTLLAYATGGLAYGGVTGRTAAFAGWTGNVIAPTLRSSNSAGYLSDTLVGWTIGGGGEWAVAPNVSVKAEYLYYDLGGARFASSPMETRLLSFFSNVVLPASEMRFQGHIARAGINYHFSLFETQAPLVAKY
jgi:outer membrane immunogenic protein